jgi:peptidoglycan/xylan/chitin deacetylase (PgdA/CDA1 family)
VASGKKAVVKRRARAVVILIGFLLSFSSCASLWKSMGVATVSSVDEQNARLATLRATVDRMSAEIDDSVDRQNALLVELKTTVDSLSARINDVQKATDDIARLESLVGELQASLRKLEGATGKTPTTTPNRVPAPASVVPFRDSQCWPQGYYPGDPLPPRTVYLTFDDGPCDFTVQILDILKEENVRATFFMNSYDKDNPFHADTGKNLMFRYAEALRRMVDEGHAIGNHTYSHRDLADLSPAQIDFQLNTLQRQLTEVLGDKTPRLYLIRPPFGSPWYSDASTDEQRKRVCSALENRGLVMLWTKGWDSSDSFDWATGEWYTTSGNRYHPGGPAYESKMEREVGRILKSADGVAGGIILMHDTHPTTRDILKSLIEELKRRGYSFGTLEDYCRWRWGATVFDRFAHVPA